MYRILIILILLLPLPLLAETTFEVVEFREDPLNQKALVNPVKDLDAQAQEIPFEQGV